MAAIRTLSPADHSAQLRKGGHRVDDRTTIGDTTSSSTATAAGLIFGNSSFRTRTADRTLAAFGT